MSFFEELLARRVWMQDAKCRGLDPELFFPQRQGDKAENAKALCQTCEVRRECAEHAFATRETDGVWGGMTRQERKLERRRRRRAA